MKSLNHIIHQSYKDKGEIHQYLSSKQSVSMLDLGCGIPYDFFNLYHIYGITEFTGIEKLGTEQSCIHDFSHRQTSSPDIEGRRLGKATSKMSTFFEVYTHLLQKSTEDPNIGLPAIENKEVFDSIFTKNVKFNSDAYKFLENKNFKQKYNIIHCNNLIHFWPLEKQRIAIEMMLMRLTENGMLYVGVTYRDHFTIDGFSKMLASVDHRINLKIKYIDDIWERAVFLLRNF